VAAGTHQGAGEDDYAQAYLHDLHFRFNRRTAKHRQWVFYRWLPMR
jgi:hypothetical protein